MPLGFTRLNERAQRPNTHINFITPLPGPSSSHSLTILNHVAAISYPIMRAHHLVVNTLEEHPANKSFVGRNFNAGEVIQLCLKNLQGGWLSFRTVVLVFMHELAHCKQMNHSSEFWKVRAEYAAHLEVLVQRGYTGEGVWGRGDKLLSYRGEHGGRGDGLELGGGGDGGVESLCGGAYRGRKGKGTGGKRKRPSSGKDKERPTYAERQQKRIQRKFGKHGDGAAVGRDEEVKAKYEKGRTTSAKPKVASSKRGRELRAAAALARFETVKREPESSVDDSTEVEDESDADETESEDEEENSLSKSDRLMDKDGRPVRDAKGHDLVRVCEEEDSNDENVRQELDELRMAESKPAQRRQPQGSGNELLMDLDKHAYEQRSHPVQEHEQSTTVATPIKIVKKSEASAKKSAGSFSDNENHSVNAAVREPVNQTTPSESNNDCPICSLANAPSSARCVACSHVLDPNQLDGAYWECPSGIQGGCVPGYRNAGDCGVCGICGQARRTD